MTDRDSWDLESSDPFLCVIHLLSPEPLPFLRPHVPACLTELCETDIPY